MCLYGNDMDETTTLVEAGLGWIVSLDGRKGDFRRGRPAVLAAQKQAGPPRKLVGFEMVGPRHRAPRLPGYLRPTSRSGTVTSGTYAPFLQKNIGLVLPAGRARRGRHGVDVDVRGRRVPARVVPTPFYKRAQ